MHTDDVVIVGAGLVGTVLAIGLMQHTPLSVRLIDRHPLFSLEKREPELRVSAIGLASQQILSALGVWESVVALNCSPFKEIQVWDASGQASLSFEAKSIGEANLGYIVPHNLLQAILHEQIKHYADRLKVITCDQPKIFTETPEGIEISTEKNVRIKAKLAIAADGGNSWLRDQAGISLNQHNYQQSAIVAEVTTSLPHQHIARQVFLAEGPLAFLPLTEPDHCSIVWSLPSAEASRISALSFEQFQQSLARAFSYRLGEIVQAKNLGVFPLCRQQARQFIKNRVVLVGDAAHRLHPLAGQGLNMGLLDAASLIEVIADAIHDEKEWTNTLVLRRYERWRKADLAPMMIGLDWIKNFFAEQNKHVQRIRYFGLSSLDHLSLVKNFLTAYAVGKRKGLPRLALS